MLEQRTMIYDLTFEKHADHAQTHPPQAQWFTLRASLPARSRTNVSMQATLWTSCESAAGTTRAGRRDLQSVLLWLDSYDRVQTWVSSSCMFKGAPLNVY